MSDQATGVIEQALLSTVLDRAIEGTKAELSAEIDKENAENEAFRAGKTVGILWWKHPMTEHEAHLSLHGYYSCMESSRIHSRLQRIESLRKTFESSNIQYITLPEYDLRLIRDYL